MIKKITLPLCSHASHANRTPRIYLSLLVLPCKSSHYYDRTGFLCVTALLEFIYRYQPRSNCPFTKHYYPTGTHENRKILTHCPNGLNETYRYSRTIAR